MTNISVGSLLYDLLVGPRCDIVREVLPQRPDGVPAEYDAQQRKHDACEEYWHLTPGDRCTRKYKDEQKSQCEPQEHRSEQEE